MRPQGRMGGDIPEPSLPPAGFREDLLTDWVPDALGGWLRALPTSSHVVPTIEWIDVWAPGRSLHVPLLDIETRAQLHILTSVALRSAPSPHPGVYGYTDDSTEYSVEWLRYQRTLRRERQRHSWVLRADLQAFFASVRRSVLETQRWMTEDLTDALARVDAASGQVLLPGYRWARRLANYLLAPMDRQVGWPFVRWQDDYTVFTESSAEAETCLARLEGAAADLGLTMNETKTRIVRVSELPDFRLHGDLTDSDIGALYSHARLAEDRTSMRFALARMARRCYSGVGGELVDDVVADASLLPRAAWYLDSSLSTGRNKGVWDEILVALSGDWALARLLPVIVRSPFARTPTAVEIAERAQSHRLAAIRDLAARILLAVHGSSGNHMSPRLERWSLEARSTNADLPAVETSL